MITDLKVDAAATTTELSIACGHRWLTSDAPGAIAILEIRGDPSGLESLLGRALPAAGTHALRRIGAVDDAVCVHLASGFIALMPHGGTALRRAITQALSTAGYPEVTAARDHWPEATDSHESEALSLLSRSASPLAIPPLLAQGRCRAQSPGFAPSADDHARAVRLRRLIEPPTVVLAGVPNAGKSTLTNALAGRDVSIVWHEPGSTRDWITTRINLSGLVVNWIDTPGIRTGTGQLEAQSIALAREAIASADLVVAIAEPGGQWPQLERPANLRVRSKADLAAGSPSAHSAPAVDISVCARSGAGLPELAQRIRDLLVPPEDLTAERPIQLSILAASATAP